jgi:protein TonB
MIGRAGWAAGGAFAVSLAVHGALLAGFALPAGQAGAPGGEARIAMMGQSFEDRVAGRVMPVAPPQPAPQAETVERVAAARPVTPTASAVSTTSPSTSAVEEAPRAAVTPIPTSTVVTPPTGTTAPPPVAREAPSEEAISAEDLPGSPFAVATSPRPAPRPERATRRAAAEASTPTPAPSGNARSDARTGEADGREEGTAATRQTEGAADTGVSAREIARYPQQVNRHLGRLRHPNTSFRGSAVVAFTIGPNGGLAALRIVRSSGNAGFDDLALAHIRRAVPFPAPPAGAQTQYSVTIRGR